MNFFKGSGEKRKCSGRIAKKLKLASKHYGKKMGISSDNRKTKRKFCHNIVIFRSNDLGKNKNFFKGSLIKFEFYQKMPVKAWISAQDRWKIINFYQRIQKKYEFIKRSQENPKYGGKIVKKRKYLTKHSKKKLQKKN